MKTVIQTGWKGIFQHFYGEVDEGDIKQISVPAVKSTCSIDSAKIKEGQTSPKKRFTEDTLLRAMETAGAEDMPEDVERKGLGTPATRAATIEKLVKRGFIERQGSRKAKHLTATESGKRLIAAMPTQLKSAAMTAEWEQKLLLVERGKLRDAAFMEEIEQSIADLVAAKGGKE